MPRAHPRRTLLLRRPFAALALLAPLAAPVAGGVPQDADVPAWAAEASPVGHWSGAFVRAGSALPIHLRLERDATGALVSYQEIPDWIWYGWLGPEQASVAEDGRLVLRTIYGEARLLADPRYREWIGPVGAMTPSMTLHLKRSVPPPRPLVREEPVAFASDVPLAGTLILPAGDGPHPCVVFLHGRGCGTRASGRMVGRALARYGVAGLAFDKRGAGESGGDCATVTFEQVATDAEAALRAALAHPAIDPARVGVLGSSAGAWTAQRLAEVAADDEALPPLAFLITWIGPSTSILEQQRDSSRAIGEEVGLSEDRIQMVLRGLDLLADRGAPAADAFAALDALRRQAEQEGWIDDLFEPDDLPASPALLDGAWLRRFRYDPTAALLRLRDVPYLAVFGAEDRVVPIETNGPRLRALLTEAGNPRFHIVAIPGIGHGVEHYDAFRELEAGRHDASYFKFERVEPRFLECTIEFLRELGVAAR